MNMLAHVSLKHISSSKILDLQDVYTFNVLILQFALQVFMPLYTPTCLA